MPFPGSSLRNAGIREKEDWKRITGDPSEEGAPGGAEARCLVPVTGFVNMS